MIFLSYVAGMLAFRVGALRALAGRRGILSGLIVFSGGYIAFVLLRNYVYAELREPVSGAGLLGSLLEMNFVQALIFFSLIYVPAVISLSNGLAADGLGLSVSREEYDRHFSVLFPLWGTIFLFTAPLQLFVPHFLVLGEFVSISIGLFALTVLSCVYTVWAIKELNYLSVTATLGVFVLSWFSLPVLYLITTFLFALPFFILLPVLYLGFQRLRSLGASRARDRESQERLHSLTGNPQDADAHYQLGLIHLDRLDLEAAERYFRNALKIEPSDPDYHYFLGRVQEAQGDWVHALEEYEATYGLNPEYKLGDIFREVGKGYLHTGKPDKAAEFLNCFLEKRSSDPEGRYWLAVVFRNRGELDRMRVQLNTIIEQARSNPRFFRRKNREWIYRSRVLLRQ